MEELNDHILEEIESYLAGDLTGDQLVDFKKRLKTDKNLADQVSLFQNVKGGIKSFYFNQHLAHHKSKYEKGSNSKSIYWMAAASVLIAIGFTFVFNYESEPKDLYSSNFTPYPYLGAPRGEVGNQGLEEIAFQAYQRNNYAEAIRNFEELLKVDSINHQYIFYLGNSYMAESKFHLAIETFKKIDNGSIYSQNSYWYLALSYFSIDDMANTRKMLRMIQPETKLGSKSKQLLEELDRL